MGVAEEAIPITAQKLPVAGFCRQAASCFQNGNNCFDDEAKHRADCTGDARLRHCLPPLENCPKTVREERTSLTSGRDTTACFAGGE